MRHVKISDHVFSLFQFVSFLSLLFLAWAYFLELLFLYCCRKMKKYKIERTQFTNDITLTNINHKLCNLTSSNEDPPINSIQDSMEEKKTEKIIKPSRKRQVIVNFLRNDTKTDDFDVMPMQNEASVQGLKVNNLRNQKMKTMGEQSKIKNILSNYRFQNIKKHFLSQMRKNSIFREPVVYEPFDEDVNENDLLRGLQIQRYLLNIGYVIGIAHTFIACLLTTLFLAFQEQFLKDDSFCQFQILSMILLIAEITLGFVRVKDVGSRKLTKIRDIANNYLRSNFLIDFACLISVITCLFSTNNYVNFLLATFFLKLPQCVDRLVKIQTKLFDSFYLQQYWGLMKVLATNFVYAHFLAILLLMMSWLDQQSSWMHKQNLMQAPWYEQYSWAYYWGTTIMLTVGFGDLSAANYKEAICLVLIQTISCMAFAYNINCIGNLLKDLRSGEIQKLKNLKILKKLCQKNEVNSDLDFKLTNHVKESFKIATKFNFDEQTQFIQKLPINLRQDFLRAANYKVLENLSFIKNFTQKTIVALAQKIEMKISHPNEILCAANDVGKLIILKQGQIGLFPTHNNQKYNKIAIDHFCVKEKQSSCLISLDFLQLPIIRKYDIKSKGYSQIFIMQTENMLSILKRKNTDVQFFYTVKDKQKINLDNYQVIKCYNCNSNHTKFRCPRLHYMPIDQQVVFKHLRRIKVSKNQRIAFKRGKAQFQALFQYKRNYEIGSKQKFVSICEMDLYSESDAIQETKSSIHKRIGVYSTANIFNNFSISDIKDKQQQYSAKKTESRHYVKDCKQVSHKEMRSNSYMSAAELVQKEVMGILNERKAETIFWNVQIDQAKDYKFYFNKCNPQCFQNFQLKRNTNSIGRSRSMLQSRAKGSLTRKHC